MTLQLMIMGSSLGGLSAISQLLPTLPEHFTYPILIVQHRWRSSHENLVALLQGHCGRRVELVEDKLEWQPGRVYLAPIDYHVLIEPGHFSLSLESPVNFTRPSIDVALESASYSLRSEAAGVVLTGTGSDGVFGLHQLCHHGGLGIVQADAEYPELPDHALAAIPDACVARLIEIPGLVLEHALKLR